MRGLNRLGLTFVATYLFIVVSVNLIDKGIGWTFEAWEAAGVEGPEMARLADLFFLDTARALIVFTAVIYATFNILIVAVVNWAGARLRRT
ncbi:hypothetical protein GH983_05075 [Agrobacterium sp. MA01]|uniref:hypothetical protein n=1 Tax=Agrobacterium sp. MA01 TaxID=2664893 RepID=UPI00129AAD2B|nr:hypothetical protein [Agrobacterium sp. MA01]QGG89870.1 hypothetical protein GH983_05075 [Agrobacterium sp. MA01]